jgi:hypothetical protein
MTTEKTGDDQLAWLEEQLSRYQSFEYITVIGHHPLGLCAPHRRMREVDTLLQKYFVSAYFAGHAHYLGRAVKNGVGYFLNGASGQNLLKDVRGGGCEKDLQAEDINTWLQHGFLRAVVDEMGLRVETWTRDGVLDSSPTIIPRTRIYESSKIV